MIKIANKSKQPEKVVLLRKSNFPIGAFTTDGVQLYFYNFDITTYGECQVMDMNNLSDINFNGSGPFIGGRNFTPDVVRSMLGAYNNWLESQHEDNCDCEECYHEEGCDCESCI